MSGQKKASGVELIGYDRQEEKFATPLASGEDPTQIESWVRAQGGRISFARITQPDRPRPAGVSPEDFARFNEMLASAVRRGVPLLDGIRNLSRDFKRGKFRTGLDRVAGNLQRGAALREAFAPEGTGFPRLYGHLIEAGAAAGNLSEVTLALGRNIRTDATFRRGIVEACVYPALLLVVCFALLSGFAATILPTYEAVARQVSVTIPTITEVVSGRSASGRLIMRILGGVIALLVILWFAKLRWTYLGRRIKEEVLRRLPFFRSFYEAALWSSAADTLALLFRARVPAPGALRLTGSATGTHWLTQVCDRLAAKAEMGKPLSAAAREDAEMPYRVIQALDTGELRNDMASALTELARQYRRESERKAGILVRYLPPALALVMGVLVFIIVLVTLGPFFKFWRAAW